MTIITGRKNNSEYIIEIKNNYAVPAGAVMNIRAQAFTNPDHNRYIDQPISFLIEEWPTKLSFRTTTNTRFRLKSFNTIPQLLVSPDSYIPRDITQYSFRLNTSVPAFKGSKFVYQFPNEISIQEKDCVLDTASFQDAECTRTSPSEFTVFINSDLPSGIFDIQIPYVMNSETVNVSEAYFFTFTSYDWEGVVMEKTTVPVYLNCSEDCEVCNATECLSCFQTSFLDMGTCVPQCPIGSYPDDTVNICRRDCVEGCLECTGTKFNCTKCQEALSLFNYTCLDSCPSNYTSQKGTCVPTPNDPSSKPSNLPENPPNKDPPVDPPVEKPSDPSIDQQEKPKDQTYAAVLVESRFSLEIGTIPIFAIYMTISFFLWVASGLHDRPSMSMTSLMVLLSFLEPCLYGYLLTTGVALNNYGLILLFSFLLVSKIALQALYVVTSIQNLIFFDPEPQLQRFCFLRILEYGYNLKLTFLRTSHLFGIDSLSLSIPIEKKISANIITFLKSSVILDIMTILGYIGYYIYCILRSQTIRLTYIEGGAYLLLQVFLTIAQVFKIKRDPRKYARTARVRNITVQDISVEHTSRSRPLNDSSAPVLYRSVGIKLESGKSGDMSMSDISTCQRGINPDISLLVKEEFGKYDKKAKPEALAKQMYKKRSVSRTWEGDTSIMFESNKELGELNFDKIEEEEGGETKRGGRMSFRRQLKKLSKKMVKTLATFSSPIKKKRMIEEIVNVKAFEKSKSDMIEVSDETKRKIVGQEELEGSLDKGPQKKDRDMIQKRWWLVGKEVSLSLVGIQKQVDGLEDGIEENECHTFRNKSSQKVVFKKISPKRLDSLCGNMAFKVLNESRLKEKNQEIDEIALE